MISLSSHPQQLVDKCIFESFISILNHKQHIDHAWESASHVFISLPSFTDYALVIREDLTQYEFDFEVREFILGISNFFIEGFITGYHNTLDTRCVTEFKNPKRAYYNRFLHPVVKIAFIPDRIVQINTPLWDESMAYHFQIYNN